MDSPWLDETLEEIEDIKELLRQKHLEIIRIIQQNNFNELFDKMETKENKLQTCIYLKASHEPEESWIN